MLDNKPRFAALAEKFDPGHGEVMPEIELLQLTREELRGLSELRPAAHFEGTLEGALPPPHVAARALQQLEAGMLDFWCAPFLIVARLDGAVLGGCTFKGAPSDGDVEIAYGVAKPMRGRGIATAAIGQLLELAAHDGSVKRVIAEILPSNLASSKVVMRLGFHERETYVDSDGETVVRWIYSIC